MSYISRLFIMFILFYPAMAYGGTSPQNGSMDARIKTFLYNDNAVYRFQGHYGFSTVIEFSPMETVDSVSIGDSKAWQIVPSNKKNILFIKPVLENAYTNMTVLTSERIYSFELSAAQAHSHQSADLAFRIKFKYPQAETLSKVVHTYHFDPFENRKDNDFNFHYSYAGSNRLKPRRVFDDGQFTYLKFDSTHALPAVFAVNNKGEESLVNFAMRGHYMVISSIHAQLTLRNGDEETCVFNDLLTTSDSVQKEPKAIDQSDMSHMAIPLPDEKPYFTAKNKDSVIGMISSLFQYDGHGSKRQIREFNQ